MTAALAVTGLMTSYLFGPKRARRAELDDGVQVLRVTVKGGYQPEVLEVAAASRCASCFGVDDLLSLLTDLGYPVTRGDIARTVDYYLVPDGRRLHPEPDCPRRGSGQVRSRRAWQVFRGTLVAALDETQGGTTREGVHLGAMAGTVDILRRTFAGLMIRETELAFTPCLPSEINGISCMLHYQGHHVRIDVNYDSVRIDSRDGPRPHRLT